MKLAHLVLAHNNPRQLARLATRLGNENADVYIHLDNKTDIAGYQDIKQLPHTWFIQNRVNVVWCEYSTIVATLNGLEEILATGTAYSHINLLSGNDYPLRNAAYIQDFLFTHSDKTFMWYDKIFNDWTHGQARINNYYFGDYGFPGRYHISNLVNKILPKRKLPDGLIAYGRAQWLTMTPEAAAYVLKYIKDHPAAERFFKMTWSVDEVFFQTILCSSPLKGTLVNDNLRCVVLQPDFRPVTFTMKDAAALSSSGKFYARKFDGSTDESIFDYIDSTLLIR